MELNKIEMEIWERFNLPLDANLREEKLKSALTVESIEKLSELIRVDKTEIINLIQVAGRPPSPSLPLKKLTFGQSQIIVRIIEIYCLILLHMLNEDKGLSSQWLKSRRDILGGKTPLEMCQTQAQADEVKTLIMRIIHGSFS